jgi:hypothetical protein
MTQKSPVMDVLSSMRTVPSCCCSHVPAILRSSRFDDLADVYLLHFSGEVLRVRLFAEAKRGKYTGNYNDGEPPNTNAFCQSQRAPRKSPCQILPKDSAAAIIFLVSVK